MSTYFDSKLKEKLDSYIPENAASNWNVFEKQIPKTPNPFWNNISIFIVSSIVVVVAIIIFRAEIDKPIASDESDLLIQSTLFDEKIDGSKNDTDGLIAEAIISDDGIQNISDNIVLQPSKIGENITDNKCINELVSPVLVNTNSAREDAPENNCLSMETEETQKQLKVINDATTEKLSTVIYSQVDKTSGCVPLAVNFSTNANPESYNITWYFKDGTKSHLPEVTHEYSNRGNYKPILVLNAKNNSCKDQRLKCDYIEVFGFESPHLIVEESLNVFTLSIESLNRPSEIHWVIDSEKYIGEFIDKEFEHDGQYIAQIMMFDKNGCKASLNEQIEVKIKHYYKMPNAFTPDGLGVNSTFGPVHENMLNLSFNMIIFNAKSQVLFESNSIENAWDGVNMFTGQVMPQGVYLYKVITVDEFENVKTRKGQVTLFRD